MTTAQLLVRSVAVTVLVTAIWAVLAIRTPTSTFHFAPIVGGVAGPWIVRSTVGPRSSSQATIFALTSAVIVAAVGLGLHVADRLRGPTFWSESGAIGEVILFAAIGAVIGFVVTVTPSAA